MINTPSTIGNVAAAPSGSEPLSSNKPPPPTPTEVVAVTPGPDYVWVDGEWDWNGLHLGLGGRSLGLSAPPPMRSGYQGRRWHDGYGWHYQSWLLALIANVVHFFRDQRRISRGPLQSLFQESESV